MHNKPILYAFLGPSGAGKTHIIEEVVQRLPNMLGILKSFVDRPPRNEQDKHNYRSVTADELAEMRRENRIIQIEPVYEFHYGTSWDEARPIIDRGASCIMAIFGKAVPDFRAAGFHVVIIRVRPVGSFVPRDPARAAIDAEREKTEPEPDLLVENVFDPNATPETFRSTQGFQDACARVEQFIYGIEATRRANRRRLS